MQEAPSHRGEHRDWFNRNSCGNRLGHTSVRTVH